MLIQDEEQLEQRDALLIMAEICNTAVAHSRAAQVHGEKLDAIDAFARVLAHTNLTTDDLVRIWAVFMLGAQAVKRHHRQLVEQQSSIQGSGARPQASAPDP